jgi:hypothetical protein
MAGYDTENTAIKNQLPTFDKLMAGSEHGGMNSCLHLTGLNIMNQKELPKYIFDCFLGIHFT